MPIFARRSSMSLLDDFYNDDDDRDDDFDANNSTNGGEDRALLAGAGGGQIVDLGPPKALEAPVFELDKVQFRPPHDIVHLVVSSNTLAMALSNCRIIRLNIDNPAEMSNVEISRRTGDRIHKLHLDPTGAHLIIAMVSEESYYIHSQWNKPRALPKLKGLVIESVAWDAAQVTPQYTGELLLGTTGGKIYQAAIEASDKGLVDRFVGGKEQKDVKQLYDLGDRHAITGLHVERFPAARGDTKFVVMATTPTRIYQFIGGPTFEALFASYATSPSFQEVPGNTARSELHFYSAFGGLPTAFAWMTGPGIFHGELMFGSQGKGDSVATDTTLLTYPRDAQSKQPIAPLSMALTEFHFLLIDSEQFRAVHKLSEESVFEQPLDRDAGRVRRLATDPVERTIWAYAERAVYEVTINDEDRDVWQMYLDRQQFETALRHCKTAAQKDRVWSAQGDYLFAQGSYELAASVYAKTLRSFEELALMFVQRNERAALRTLLLRKLARLRAGRDETQITALCMWLVEIHLERLNEARDALQHFDSQTTDSSAKSGASGKARTEAGDARARQAKRAALEQRITLCADELRAFVREWRAHLDRRATMALMGAHGREDELLAYATMVGDHARVVEHHLQRQEWGKALDVLCQQDNLELYYKYSPPLMHHVPYETVNVWIGEPRLEPRRLIPALMRYDVKNNPRGELQNQAVRYLEHCLYRLRIVDRAVYDYALSLHARVEDEKALLLFLSKPETLQIIDLKYALRLCTKHGKTRACVLVYSALGLHEEAVELALKVDIALAKEQADKPEDDDELRKKLWLRVARHVVQQQKDIKQAMSFLQECDLLQIEDILPFFPDFTRIDAFRDEICASLEEYGGHINQLKQQMTEATRSADLIRADIKELRNKYGFVSATQKCDLCHYNAMSRQFYLFPCQHTVHADCLTKEVLAHSSNMTRRRVAELAQKLADTAVEPIATASSQENDARRAAHEQRVDALRSELNSLVAGECVFCGDLMMRSVDRPFIEANEQAEIDAWHID